MHSPIAVTALLEPMPRRPIHPKAAARLPAAFRALLRFSTRTVRKPQAVVALATIEASRTTNELGRRRRLRRDPFCFASIEALRYSVGERTYSMSSHHFHAVIWIDHHEARVFHFSPTDV